MNTPKEDFRDQFKKTLQTIIQYQVKLGKLQRNQTNTRNILEMKECLSTIQRTLEFSSVLAKISASSMAGKINVSFRLVKKAINSHATITSKVN